MVVGLPFDFNEHLLSHERCTIIIPYDYRLLLGILCYSLVFLYSMLNLASNLSSVVRQYASFIYSNVSLQPAEIYHRLKLQVSIQRRRHKYC